MVRSGKEPTDLPPGVLMAHRGYPAQYPENSVVGVRAALEAGARMVEFDVQLSADGVPVVIHDEGLARTSGHAGSVLDLYATALAGIDISESRRLGDRYRDTPLPTLEDMLALVDAHPTATAFIELKCASMRRFGRDVMVASVMALVGRDDHRVVISGDPGMAVRARSAGAARIGWVTPSLDTGNERAARELMPDFLFIGAGGVPAGDHPFWTGAWRWVVYGVNDLARARDLLGRGADVIETDSIGTFLRRCGDNA